MGAVVQLGEARARRSARQATVDEDWVSKAHIAAHFKVCTRTIENWMAKGLPYAKRFPNSHAKFKVSLCDAWYEGR
jgi:phage terminase Nu1 subunit (DNA packaging protein)